MYETPNRFRKRIREKQCVCSHKRQATFVTNLTKAAQREPNGWSGGSHCRVVGQT